MDNEDNAVITEVAVIEHFKDGKTIWDIEVSWGKGTSYFKGLNYKEMNKHLAMFKID